MSRWRRGHNCLLLLHPHPKNAIGYPLGQTDAVLFSGKQELHHEGAYYLESRDGAKRVRVSVGKDAADASARRQRKGKRNSMR
jgi:hypothetical protein